MAEKLSAKRTKWKQDSIKMMIDFGYLVKDEDPKFSCDDCPDVNKCQFAFDPYNTHGDCLDIK